MSIFSSTAAVASDLDIYQHRIAKTAPNVLFLLDNSASMNAADLNASLDYNASTTYNGPFDSDFVYYGADGFVPKSPKTNFKLDKDAENRCDASKRPLATTGIYADRMAVRSAYSDRWTIPKAIIEDDTSPETFLLECAADAGIHGYEANSAKSFANRKALDDKGRPSLWTATSSSAVNWKIYPSMSLFTANYLNYRHNPPKNTDIGVQTSSGWLSNSRFKSATQVLADIINTVSRPNFGLITYNPATATPTYKTGNAQIRVPLRNIATDRQSMLSAIDLNAEPFEFNPPISMRTQDRYWATDKRHKLSALDSDLGYAAIDTSTAGWVEIPVARHQKVLGIITQGRGPIWPAEQWVKKYRIETRGWDGAVPASQTQSYDGGRVFNANTDNNTRVSNLIPLPEDISGVRIIPTQWHNHSTFRVGLLTAETPIKSAGATYIGDSMAIALRYLSGKKSYLPTVELLADPTEVGSPSNALFQFKTPIVAECQNNAMILLTDGFPSNDDQYINQPTTIPGLSPNCATDDSSCTNDYAALANKPQTLINVNGDTITSKPIKSYAIDYGIRPSATASQSTVRAADDRSSILSRVAEAGGGKMYPAQNRHELDAALFDIFNSFETTNYSLATPGSASTSSSQYLTGVNYIYPVFEPSSRMAWRGNLKKYRRQEVNGKKVVADRYGKPALVEGNAINPLSVNLWSAKNDDGSDNMINGVFVADGADVLEGGVAARLTDKYIASRRKIYTDVNNWGPLRASDPGTIGLMAKIISENAGNDDPETVLNWVLGVDVNDDDNDGRTDDSNHYLGAFIHSEPLIIRVSDEFAGLSAEQSAADGDSTNQLTAIGASSGMAHFFNGAGNELAAYLPSRHFENAYRHYNRTQAADFAYGWDGQFAKLHEDDNNNGIVDKGEYLRVVAGEGRGSNKVTAFDISRIFDNQLSSVWEFPDLDTKIGRAFDASLGQSWSKPQLVKLKFGGQTRRLVLISGGYSPIMDAAFKPVPRGNQIILLDAQTGLPFWWAGKQLESGLNPNLVLEDMNYPIPADPSPVDVDGDGTMDILFVGDTAGQIFRIDFDDNGVDADKNNSVTAGSQAEIIAQGGLILDGPRASAERKQRSFFEKIAVASRQNDKGLELSLLAVSGHKGDTLSLETNDALFHIRQSDVFNGPTSYSPLRPSALYDIKNDDISNEVKKQKGWIYKFSPGEKGLTSPLVINNKVAVSTYIPPVNDNAGNRCGTSIGDNREYFLNTADASGALSNGDAYQENIDGGMPIGTELSIIKDTNQNNPSNGGSGSTSEKCIQATIASHNNPIAECIGETLDRKYWSDRILPNN